MITILVPSRARPNEFKRMVESVRKTSGGDVKIYVCLRPGDMHIYREVLGNLMNDIKIMIAPDNLPTAHKWNLMAEHAMTDIMMLGADDMVFATSLWDQALLDHYSSLDDKRHVYALQDSRDESGTPHPMMTKEYVQAMGYFVPPIFLHWFIDSWTVKIANEKFTHLKDYLLVHEKPSDRGAADETHNRIRESGWHERDQWVATCCEDWLDDQIRKLS